MCGFPGHGGRGDPSSAEEGPGHPIGGSPGKGESHLPVQVATKSLCLALLGEGSEQSITSTVFRATCDLRVKVQGLLSM